MARDPETLAHVEWLGYVQPVGLVVSIPALLSAQAHINRNILPEHQRFLSCLPQDKFDQPIPDLRDFAEFSRSVLGWRASDLETVVPGDARYASLEIALPEYHETLRPTHVIREYEPKDAAHPWMMLIQELPSGTLLDDVGTTDDRHWQATPQVKFERLLRETKVPVGLLISSTYLRLVYAPRGETSGYATFSVPEMAQVAGRPIFAALHMLLCEERLFSLGEKQRLSAILADSRKYQNHVSNELAQQVLAALYELLRGFQAADEATKGELLRAVLAENPNHVYNGLLTALMRLVFVLYAEDRGLISNDPVYTNFYSITGLFERLRADAGRFPDTMDQRYGAWAQLLTLFRLIYEGGSHGGLSIPARKGYLFDPDRYNFLEGREWKTPRRLLDKPADVPRVSDGVIFRVLNNLLILDGERLSYRTLDVEQIGSVYETMMGFGLEVAQGRSIAIKPKKSHGAPTTINLETLLDAKPAERNKWLKAQADQELSGQAATALKDAATVEDLLAALDKRIAKNVTPNVVAKETMAFQPSDERRRSGSHYTPRSLTEPIVRTTLRPILEQLGKHPSPEQILALNVCDPAMGSGAFLVEVCRQLGDELVKAWHVHKCVPKLPPDEDELLHARRLIAQQCLYGVDKNPMAVDLSKLSLWLATLAKDHPFTFLDHSLRCGDSLVGLSREQIAAFHWQPSDQKHLLQQELTAQIGRATEARRKIISAPESAPYADQQQALAVADEALDRVRRIGDLVIAAFFSADKPRPRETKLNEHLSLVTRVRGKDGRAEDVAEWIRIVNSLNSGDHPIQPFHWQIEFPEVFTVDPNGKPTGGFDAIVGNPPFVGVKILGETTREHYTDWLRQQNPDSGGKCDLVAFFFRRAHDCLRTTGTIGFIATKTIGQGDTRRSGLAFLVRNGAIIYSATKRLAWPGQAAVIVSVVHLAHYTVPPPYLLDGMSVKRISSYLLDSGYEDDPHQLQASTGFGFLGSKLLGMGFIFDDANTACPATSLIGDIVAKRPASARLIKPYIGGEELNSISQIEYGKHVIDFGDMDESQARQHPELLSVLEQHVRPQRNRSSGSEKERWWQYAHRAGHLYEAIATQSRFLVLAQYSQTFAFAFIRTGGIINSKLVGFATDKTSRFSVLQSRVHESWARFFSGTLKDDLQYTPSACLVTFPFPKWKDSEAELERTGELVYALRHRIMQFNGEGLTKTYNRFHDPDERCADILQLRELHAAMDRAVLEAYGWHDLAQTATCEFLLDYEEDENDEEESSGRRRRKPWRYRWPDDFRDEVLARLLALNAERAEQERLTGTAAQAAEKKGKKATTKPVSKPTLPGFDETELTDIDRIALIVLAAWGRQTQVDRMLFGQAMLLWKNNKHRTHLLGQGDEPRRTPSSVGSIPQIIGRLINQGWIEGRESEGIQWLWLANLQSPVGTLTVDEEKRIEEIRQVVERQRQSDEGIVEQTEDSIRATKEFVHS